MTTIGTPASKRKREDEEPNGARRFNPSFSMIATIITTRDGVEESFTAHHDVLCRRSRYFERACASTGSSEQEQHYSVLRPSFNVHSYVLRIYLQTIYVSEELIRPVVCSAIAGHQEGQNGPARSAWHVLGLSWVLAYRLEDLVLKNMVTDCLIDKSISGVVVPLLTTIQGIVKFTPRKSALRRWLVDRMAEELTVEALDDAGGQYPAEIRVEILKRKVPTKGLAKEGAFSLTAW